MELKGEPHRVWQWMGGGALSPWRKKIVLPDDVPGYSVATPKIKKVGNSVPGNSAANTVPGKHSVSTSSASQDFGSSEVASAQSLDMAPTGMSDRVEGMDCGVII